MQRRAAAQEASREPLSCLCSLKIDLESLTPGLCPLPPLQVIYLLHPNNKELKERKILEPLL
jgi:hypothetical protein